MSLRRKREKGVENISDEIMAENFPNMKRKQIPKYRNHKVPNKMNPKKPIPRHIIIKMEKVKGKERKQAREKQSHKQGNPHNAISRLFSRNFAGQKKVA